MNQSIMKVLQTIRDKIQSVPKFFDILAWKANLWNFVYLSKPILMQIFTSPYQFLLDSGIGLVTFQPFYSGRWLANEYQYLSIMNYPVNRTNIYNLYILSLLYNICTLYSVECSCKLTHQLLYSHDNNTCPRIFLLQIVFRNKNIFSRIKWKGWRTILDLTRNTGICLQEHSTEYNVHILYNKDKMYRL
jgi:hypothetical protein